MTSRSCNRWLSVRAGAAWALCIAITFLVPSPANAQVRVLSIGGYGGMQDPFDGEFYEDVAYEADFDEMSAASEASGAAADPAAAAEEARKQMRAQLIKAAKFDRRPSAILNLWAQEAKELKAEQTSQPEQASPTITETTNAEKASPESTSGEAVVETTSEEATAEEAALGTDKAEGSATETIDTGLADAEAKAVTEAGAAADSSEAQAAAQAAAELAAKKAEELEKEKSAFEKILKELCASVTLGRWERFGEMLKDRALFSEDESLTLYRQMLQQLSTDVGVDFTQVVGLSDEMQKLMQSMAANRRNNPGQQYAEKHTISFADLLAMIAVTPKALEDSDVQALAGLLRLTLQTGSQLDDFVQGLKSGGDKLLARDQAAQLLSQAGCNEHTPQFMVSVEEAKTSGNAKILNLWALHFLTMHGKEIKESYREQAWEATLSVLELSQADDAARKEALTRAVSLAPKLREDLGQAWLMDSFTKFPERGKEILAAIGTATAQRLAQMPQDGQERLRNLKLQRAAVDALIKTSPEIDQQWTAILNLLASNWLQEAQVSHSYSQSSRYGPGMRRDMYGNIYYVNPEDDLEPGVQPLRMGQIVPVEPNEILNVAPDGEWFEVIQASVRPQYTMMLCKLWLKVNEDAKAFPYIESLAQSHPDAARELAEEFLKVWTKNHNPNQESERTNYYMFMYGYETKADKIPLTRSKQKRNLSELSEWISRLRALPIADAIDQKLVVRAFMTCHSVAEVYDVSDITAIFGEWSKLSPATMAALIQSMRGNLAGLWRDPNVQRDAGTKRKKSDIQDEVKRGYAVAKNVLDKALEVHPDDWQLLLARASVMHDENDFVHEVSPSSEFSKRREAAFSVFATAAENYVAKAADLPEREQSNDVFERWFYATLGATDLNGVSEKNQLAPGEVEKIVAAMNQLQGEIGQRHKDKFANALFSRMSAVSPSCKARYLDAGFRLVGDNPLADEARQVHNYYKDLVTELELVVRVDGDTRVGHKEPFGVYVDLKHTKELERESGGFGKYLQNQNSMYYAYNYGRPTENYRDKFQDATMAALQEHFEVLSVTFNHADVKSRSIGKDGWRVTPYAYLLLKARGPEVDKLPALRLDMDFLDTSGYVVLPVGSAPLAIDAAVDRRQPNASDIKLVQVLDERKSKDGKLIVEAKATAKGLVPGLDTLLDVKQEGFTLEGTADSGVSVIEFDKEASETVILSERTFTLTYVPTDPAGSAPTSFAFATPVLNVADSSFQRYVDADLETVEPVVALVEEYGTPWRAWLIGGLCALVGLVVLIGAGLALRSRSGQETGVAQTQDTPLTPFSLLSQLKSVYEDQAIPVEQRSRLKEDIIQVERHYFAETNSSLKPNLQEIARRWI